VLKGTHFNKSLVYENTTKEELDTLIESIVNDRHDEYFKTNN